MTDRPSPAPGTDTVLDKHQFDIGAFERYLTQHVPDYAGPTTVWQFRGGQSNPTYYVHTPSREYVLRRKPPGKLLPSAHAVEREYRVITALQGTGVPVPKTYVLCEDTEIIGTAFYLMEYVRGRIMPDPRLPDLPPRERAAIYDSMNQVLAALHCVDWQAVGLGDFGRTGAYVARQIHRWSQQYRASETERIEAMERLIAWLPEHIPAEDETSLVHGDFRLHNSVVHPTEPRIVALLDWELSTLGHPLSDVAYNCLPFRLPGDVFEGFAGNVPEGIPSEEAYVAAYCKRTGRTHIPHWDYYVAFSMFRLSAIAQGIMGRVVSGTANDPNARARGARARPLAEQGWRVLEEAGAV